MSAIHDWTLTVKCSCLMATLLIAALSVSSVFSRSFPSNFYILLTFICLVVSTHLCIIIQYTCHCFACEFCARQLSILSRLSQLAFMSLWRVCSLCFEACVVCSSMDRRARCCHLSYADCVSGNHESITMNQMYGFDGEVRSKYPLLRHQKRLCVYWRKN